MILNQVILSLSLDLLGGEHFRPLKTGDIPVYLDLSFNYLHVSEFISNYLWGTTFSGIAFFVIYLEFSCVILSSLSKISFNSDIFAY